eukprot:1017753-Prymnesium_polylepis.1
MAMASVNMTIRMQMSAFWILLLPALFSVHENWDLVRRLRASHRRRDRGTRGGRALVERAVLMRSSSSTSVALDWNAAMPPPRSLPAAFAAPRMECS